METLRTTRISKLRGMLRAFFHFFGGHKDTSDSIHTVLKSNPLSVVSIASEEVGSMPASSSSRYQPRLLKDMDQEVMRAVLDAACEIPAFPAVISELVACLHSPNVSEARVSELVQLDPSLSTSVLRVANSALYATDQTVVSVKTGVMLIGFDLLQSIAMRGAVSGMIQMDRVKASKQDPDALWAHSIAASMYARELAQRLPRMESSEAVTAGLLHDIGKIVMCMCYPDKVADLINPQTSLLGESLLAKEERLFGACHTVFGAVLAKNWGLPDSLVCAIELHHHGNCADRLKSYSKHIRDLTIVTCLANQFAKLGGFSGNDNEIDIFSPEVTDRLNLPCDLMEAMKKMPKDMPKRINTVISCL